MNMSPKQNFWTAVVLILIIPLFPIGLEFFSTMNCLDSTVLITAAVYTITVFSTSKNIFEFILSFLLFGILCWLYGRTAAGQHAVVSIIKTVTQKGVEVSQSQTHIDPPHNWVALVVGAVVIIITMYSHGQERWKRHVIGNEIFFESFNK